MSEASTSIARHGGRGWVGRRETVCCKARGPQLCIDDVESPATVGCQLKAKLGVVTEPRGGLEGLSLQCQEVLILEQARRQVRVKGAEDGCVDAPGLGPTAEICDGGTRLPCGCGVGARATPFVPGGLREVGLCEVRV